MDRKVVNPEPQTDHAVHPKKAAKNSMVMVVTAVITMEVAISSSHSEEVTMVVKIDREMEMIVSHITETICAKMVEMTVEVDMVVVMTVVADIMVVAQDHHIKIELEILLDTREVKGLVTTAKVATMVEATEITIVVAVTEVVTMEEVSTKTEMVLLEVTAHAITTMAAQEIAEAVIDPVTNAEVVLPKAIVTSDHIGLFKFISNPPG